MLKTCVKTGVAAMLALAMASGAASAVTELLGGGVLVPEGSECASHGWRGPQPVVARLELQGAPGNSTTESQLALLLGTGTIAMRFDYNGGNPMGPAQTLRSATYVWNGPWTPERPSMTIGWHRYGASMSASTTYDHEWVLYFNNFNEHAGCRMMAVLSLRKN